MHQEEKMNFRNSVTLFFSVFIILQAKADVKNCVQYYENNEVEVGFVCLEQKAKEGNVIAEYYLGQAYESGFGVESDYDSMIYWYEMAAKHGAGDAYLSLKSYNHYDRTLKVDYFERALKNHSPAALLVRGLQLQEQNDISGKQLFNAAYQVLEKQYQNPFNISHQFHLARLSSIAPSIVDTNGKSVDQLILDAQIYLNEQKEKNNPRAIRMLALAMELESNQLTRESTNLYQQAANLGDMYSISTLQSFYYYTANGYNGDKDKAFQIAKIGAKHGLPSSMLILGRVYFKGEAPKKNLQKAIYWFEKVQGYPSFNIASSMYLRKIAEEQYESNDYLDVVPGLDNSAGDISVLISLSSAKNTYSVDDIETSVKNFVHSNKIGVYEEKLIESNTIEIYINAGRMRDSAKSIASHLRANFSKLEFHISDQYQSIFEE